jgi:integrase
MAIPNIRYVFDRKKTATKKNKALIQLEVSFEQKKKYISTGIKIYSDQWSDRNYVIRSQFVTEYNDKLITMISEIRHWVNDLYSRGDVFTFEKLEKYLSAPKTSDSFIDFIRERIKNDNSIADGTKRNHKSLIESLEKFGKIVTFADLTKTNVKLYDDWLHTQTTKMGAKVGQNDKNKPVVIQQTTVSDYHKRLKRFINEAISFELIKENPYEGLKFERGKCHERKFLTMEELKKLEDCKIENMCYDRVRDLFVFECYTGIGYSDLTKFNWHNVKKDGEDYIIQDARVKTGEVYSVLLLPKAMEILQKYDFELPIICLNDYNKFLKFVQVVAGIEKTLTSYMSRHTFATLALSNGMRIESVSKALGHTNIVTTQIYAKILNKDVVDDFRKLKDKLK